MTAYGTLIDNTLHPAPRAVRIGGAVVMDQGCDQHDVHRVHQVAKAVLRESPRCVSRDTESVPGSVITTWYRNGKPDTKGPAVITNILRNVVGEEQRNPVQEIAERWRVAATNAQTQAQAWMANATNAQARVERVSAALDEKRAEYEQKRDAAALPSTKLIYQAFIDAIDRIKERLDREGD